MAESAGGDPPALFTAASMRPKWSTTASTAAAAASGSRRSAAWKNHPSGRGASGSCRAQTATEAPAAAKRDAMPRPTPLAPPVISATRPVRSISTAMGGTLTARLPSPRMGVNGPDTGISTSVGADGIAEVVMDAPPVNALPVAGWFDLAEAITRPRP